MQGLQLTIARHVIASFCLSNPALFYACNTGQLSATNSRTNRLGQVEDTGFMVASAAQCHIAGLKFELQEACPEYLKSLINRGRLAGVQAELILGAVERKARSAQPSNSTYLEQRVQYLREDAQLVDEESQGVMMAWEGPLMQAHAKVPLHAALRTSHTSVMQSVMHQSCTSHAPHHVKFFFFISVHSLPL